MILSDSQNCDGNTSYSDSGSMQTIAPTMYCDTVYSSSAYMPTYIAMLNGPHKMTGKFMNKFEFQSVSENAKVPGIVSDEEESIDVHDIPVKLERPQYLAIPHAKYLISDGNFCVERKTDKLQREHKSLPDINFFIKTPKTEGVFTDRSKRSAAISKTDELNPSTTVAMDYFGNKSAVFVDLDEQTWTNKETMCGKVTPEPSIRIKGNECPEQISPNLKMPTLPNYGYQVKCERQHDSIPHITTSSLRHFRESVVTFTPTTGQNSTPNCCCIHHSASGTLSIPGGHYIDNSCYLTATCMKGSAQYPTPMDIDDQEALNPHMPDGVDSSYSASPCSISSSTSPIEVSHLTTSAIKEPKETTRQFQSDENGTKLAFITTESCLNLETGTQSVSYMEEIINEVIKTVEVACFQLQLSSDPKLWTEEQVQKWVNWTIKHYKLPSSNDTIMRVTGKQLCELKEAEIRALAPESGDVLHAHLEIWKTVVESNNRYNTDHHEENENSHFDKPGEDYKRSPNSSFDSQDSTKTQQDLNKAEDAIAVMTPNYTAGIHLWQFLKELLLQPHLYGQYIRWLDKESGIFKIEDSVEVARLWGIRKNRPAMNYDKLSRSIRQYYKKGIIKKTEVSQRLVYQFVKPIV